MDGGSAFAEACEEVGGVTGGAPKGEITADGGVPGGAPKGAVGGILAGSKAFDPYNMGFITSSVRLGFI